MQTHKFDSPAQCAEYGGHAENVRVDDVTRETPETVRVDATCLDCGAKIHGYGPHDDEPREWMVNNEG